MWLFAAEKNGEGKEGWPGKGRSCCLCHWLLHVPVGAGHWDGGTVGQQDSRTAALLGPFPQACAGCCTTASQPRLRDAQSHRTSPCIQQSASVSNAGETITNTQCRKLICRQTSVLITGKVKKKTLSASARAPASSRS